MSVYPSARPSVCPHVSVLLPLDWFACSLLLQLLLKPFEMLQIALKLGKNVGHCTWRPKYVLLLPVILYRHKSAAFEWNGVTLVEWPRMYNSYANAPQYYVIRIVPILFVNNVTCISVWYTVKITPSRCGFDNALVPKHLSRIFEACHRISSFQSYSKVTVYSYLWYSHCPAFCNDIYAERLALWWLHS
jgi:hypothetical protein